MNIRERLCEAYFQIRKGSEALRKDGVPFECTVWHQVGKTMVRYAASQKLMVYDIEDGVEVCIVFPDETSRTYA